MSDPSNRAVVKAPLNTERFEILREIGRGGSGVIYEAFDKELGERVALKTLREIDAQGLYDLKREFRALVDIRHPNLSRLGVLHGVEGQWFFTMELLEPVDFVTYVTGEAPGRPQPSSDETLAFDSGNATRTEPAQLHDTIRRVDPGDVKKRPPRTPRPAAGLRVAHKIFDEEKLRDAFAQLVRGLCALHDAGKVHLDIKPSNVLVDGDRVVIVDFGLARQFQRAKADDTGADLQEGNWGGTPAYMAPEQVTDEKMTPAADWYAVGVMLYEAMTAQLPFSSPHFIQLFASKSNEHYIPPSTLVRELPQDLETLCVALLSNNPDKRPLGMDLLRVFGRQTKANANPAKARPTTFIGRREELSTLTEVYERCQRERVVASVLVRGDPGMGKSALVEHFLDKIKATVPDDEAILVLRGRCYANEAVPFKAFDRIIDQLTRYLMNSKNIATAVLPPSVHTVANLFPVLRRVPAVAKHKDTYKEGPEQLRRVAFAALKWIFAALTTHTRLILYIDDLQWADQESVALIDALLTTDPPPLMLVATMRSPTSNDDTQTALGPSTLARFQVLEIGGLTTDTSITLLNEIWANTAQPTPKLINRLVQEAEGHPLFLKHLARFAERSTRKLGLEEAIWQRVNALPAPAKTLVEVVAIAGSPLPREVLAKIARLSLEDCTHWLRVLQDQDLVSIAPTAAHGSVVSPYHDRVSEAIGVKLLRATQRAFQPGRIQQIELSVGRFLKEQLNNTETEGEKIFHVVQHLNAAVSLIDDPDERQELLHLNIQAATRAVAATAYSHALSFLVVAKSLLPSEPWDAAYAPRRDIAMGKIACFYQLGEQEQARQVLDELLQHATLLDKANAYASWTALASGKRRCYEAIDVAREGLALLGSTLPAKGGKGSVLIEHARVKWYARGRTHAQLLETKREDDPLKTAEIEILVAVAPAAFFVDSMLLALIQTRLVVRSLRDGFCPASAYGLAGYGLVLAGAFGAIEDAKRYGQLAEATAERFPGGLYGVKAEFLRATFIDWRGRTLRETREALEASIHACMQAGDTEYAAYSLVSFVVVVLDEGRPLHETHARVVGAIEIAKLIDDTDTTAIIEEQLRFHELQRDQALAATYDRDLPASLTDEETPAAVFWHYYLQAQALYFFGDGEGLERAAAMLEAAETRRARIFSLPSLVAFELFHVMLAARRADTAAGPERRKLSKAVRKHLKALEKVTRADTTGTFEHMVCIGRAEAARIKGRKEEARASLEQAIEAASRSEAVRWEAHATALLARLEQGSPDS